MGLLSEGSALDWEDTKKYAQHVKEHGVKQFINLYNRLRDRPRDMLKFGDELEYTLIKLDPGSKTAKVLLKAEELLPVLQETENARPQVCNSLWRPEYGSYHLEASPGKPYGCLHAYLNTIEANMKLRRQEICKLLGGGEAVVTIATFPRLGCPRFSVPSYEPNPTDGGVFNSIFLPDESIYQAHPRFLTFTRNIRKRRGENIAINVPIYRDKNTPSSFVEQFPDDDIYGACMRHSKPDHIYMDSTGFGFGCTSLQVTIQACDLDEARHLYDQLATVCPIMLALGAGSPIKRGYLADVDTRWFVLSEACDDRTRKERGLEGCVELLRKNNEDLPFFLHVAQPVKNNARRISNSRFDSIDSYLSDEGERYCDIDLEFDEKLYQEMVDSGIERQLARHVAHLFIRDPISLFMEKIHQDDENDTDHFENIQSTVWQTMRFKPPPANSDIGWRVEFRPMESQLTDFENAAYVVFIVLLTRTILTFNLNLLMPLSQVDSNMKTANVRDAIKRFQFYFTKDVWARSTCGDTSEDTTLMTVDTIINGGTLNDGKHFPGLVPLIKQYLNTAESTDVDTMCTVQRYLQLISDRASGKLMTAAHWMREFVRNHPKYQHDSVVSEEMNFDLMQACIDITNGKRNEPGFIPAEQSKTKVVIPECFKSQAEEEEKTDRMRQKEWQEILTQYSLKLTD